MTSKVYTIEAFKENYIFTSLSDYKISPSIENLPVINVKTYHLCGNLQIAQESMANKKRVILLQNADEQELSRTTTDLNGKFCFYVKPGTYNLLPVVEPDESKAGLILTSSLSRVTVTNSPILDVLFLQARVSVSGHVHCLEKNCDSSVSVSLLSKTNGRKILSGSEF